MSTAAVAVPVAALTLRDGRNLTYATYGDPSGMPIFLFHGSPGSRLDRPPDQSILTTLGARLIVPDRPGYGRSTFRKGQLLDWPGDVAQLADALGFVRFAVVGISGGGPFALACAHQLLGRVTSVTLVAGIAPPEAPDYWQGMDAFDTLELRAAKYLPFSLLSWAYATQVHAFLRDPSAYIANLAEHYPQADRAILGDPAIQAIFAESIAEAYRQGARAHVWDDKLFTHPWGFRLADIPTPVRIWQGDADVIVPQSHARYLASALPNSVATFLPGEGHLSLPVNHYDAIIGGIISDTSDSYAEAV